LTPFGEGSGNKKFGGFKKIMVKNITKKIITIGVVLIMAFSLLACRGKNYTEVETEDMVDCSLFHYFIARSWIGDPINLNNSDEAAIFDCSVDIGILDNFQNQNGKNVQVKSSEGFWWTPEEQRSGDEQIFVEVVLKLNSKILGYAVIEIYTNDQFGDNYYAKNIKSALFPKVNGKYQNITEKQVKKIIKKVIGENTL